MNDMPPVVKVAIDKAEKLLNAAGVTWAMKLPDGTNRGNPEAFIPTGILPGENGKLHRYNFSKLGYQKVVDDMVEGDVRTFDSPDPTLTKRYRQTIAGYAGRVFGPGNFITTSNKTRIELLCTGRRPQGEPYGQE